MDGTTRGVGAALLALAAVAAAPDRASACGGFFCQRAPMNQAGENILFSVEGDGTLTTHVQILYDGAADRFAWILPLPSVPTSVGVGTDALFAELGFRTRPRFETDSRVEGTCRAAPRCPYVGGYYEDSDRGSPFAMGASSADAAAADAGAVTVYLREAVGPYDAVVLGSTSTDELFLWLDENGYDIPDVSRPIVAEYVAARHVFVAIRLVAGAGTREIQPLVLHYAEGQPCVPLRLTAIATVPDMPIMAYFLADRYATPSNYSLLDAPLDDVRLWRDPSYYTTWVSNAADDAGGRAWITEYAGATPSIPDLALPSVADLASTLEPGAFLRELRSRGFQGDSQLLGILMRFLPAPADRYPAGNESQYYNCLWQSWSSAAECGYTGGFDPAALVDTLTRQVVQPRQDAQAMLARHPRLTRLFTTMSAEEMTVDPLFSLDPAVPALSNVHTATVVTECSNEYIDWAAPQRLEMPSGATAPWREGVPYPGTDLQYCEDYRSGLFAPWTSIELRRQTAFQRAIRPAGGGPRCSAGGAGPSTAALLVLGAAAFLWLRRR
jgi:hypothetical protein